MPIYEYECADCGKHFEIFQKMSAKPLTECRLCKGALNKLISNCSFQLKGTGWYATDYKKPADDAVKKASSGNGGKDSDASGAKTETSAATATNTKTETKAETKTETTSASTQHHS